MKRINTYKLHSAMNVATEINGNGRMSPPKDASDREALYAMLDTHGYVWDTQQQEWRKRKVTRANRYNKPKSGNQLLLVRLMGTREVLAKNMENFTLAMEVAGYEIIDVDGPKQNQENAFYRVYLRIKVN